MSALVYRITYLLQMLLDHVPIGTNRGLLQLLLVLLSGRLLNSRGALFPALSDLGLDAPEVRRAEAALTYGRFDTNELVTVWQKMVLAEGRFHPHEFEGYRPVACDLTGFFRPQLQNLIGKHFHAASDRALPAVSLGMVAAVGSVGTKRLALARVLLTPQEGEKSEKELRLRTLRRAAEGLAAQEVLIVDAEFEVSELKQAGVARFVARAAANFTAPRNYPPAYKGHGPHPQYGETVRPLERAYRDKVLASTPPDAVARWKVGKRHVKAFLWEDLVGSEQKPGETCVRCVAIFDPKYKHPLVLVTNLAITAYALWCLYTDRWPIEQLPLAAKQMLGAARSFVFGQQSRLRLPVMGLLAGNLLSYVAATEQALPTGFWDRCAEPTCGRVRRVLSGVQFKDLPVLCARFRKKASVTGHLRTGVQGHRRQRAQPTVMECLKAA